MRVPRQGFRHQRDGDFTYFTMKNEDLIIKNGDSSGFSHKMGIFHETAVGSCQYQHISSGNLLQF